MLNLVVPENAQLQERQLIRLLVAVVGEPGEIEARGHVSVVKRARGKPGVPTVVGTSTVGMTRLGMAGVTGALKRGALTVSTKFGRDSSFSLSYNQGLAENLTNFREDVEDRTRTAGNLRHAGWEANFGNYIPSPGDALTGPYVLGRGVSVRRPAKRLLTEFVLAQPTTFYEGASGHLMRGRVGLRTAKATIAVAMSQFSREDGGYSTLLPSTQQVVLDADEEEELRSSAG